MALTIKDRVKESTTMTGTGAITLAGAPVGFQTFSTIGNGNTTYYALYSTVINEWEVGIGTYTSASNSIARTTVLASSNGGALVNFAFGAKEVICGLPASVFAGVQTKLNDLVSVKDFGAVGDGVTDDTAAIQAAAAQSPYYTPPGTYVSSTANATLLSGKQYGVGQIKTADANKSAPYFSVVSTAPSSFGNESSILTAFNGDLSRCQFPVGHSITGTATLGQPTTGYLYRPEAAPHYTFLYNSSGWNQSTSGNGGRTGATAYRTKVFQAGQGDSVCYNGSVFVTGTKAGSTDFLANPAGSLFNGDMAAGAAGVYLNPYETFCSDQGYDVACVGVVNNFERTVSTGAKSAVWLGYRAQSVGAASCDAIVSATGKWVTGVDLAIGTLDFGTNKAAISLKADDRIYFNNTAVASGNLVADWRTTVFNKDYLEYNTAGGFIQFVRNNSSKLQIGTTNILVANAVLGVNNGTGGSTAWIRDRQVGFALPTGTTNTATFDTATVTTARLAEYVKGMVERLHASTSGAHWLFGA
jgi:hypothetical protein